MKLGEITESELKAWSKPSVVMTNLQLVVTLMDIVVFQGERIRRLETQLDNLWDNIDTLNTIVLDPLDGVPDSPELEYEEDSAPSEVSNVASIKH